MKPGSTGLTTLLVSLLGLASASQSHGQETAAQSSIEQNGADLSAIIEQHPAGGYQEASISQSGALHEAYILQTQPNATAHIEQTGDNNGATIAQTGYESYRQRASVSQHGDDNLAEVTQTELGNNTLDATITGDANIITTTQWQGSGFSVGLAEIFMDINGNSNEVVVEQADNGLGEFKLTLVSSNNNYINVYQTGESADLSLKSQYSDGNTDLIRQRALGGLTEISRYYTDNSLVDVTQDASGETLFIAQGHSENATARINQVSLMQSDITVWQVHSANVTTGLDQYSSFSEIYVKQEDGSNNEAYVRQGTSVDGGNQLIASIYQLDGADTAYADIGQNGEANIALIEQLDASEVTARIQQDGMSSYAEIVQTSGFSNNATIQQAAEGVSATIHQGGSFNEATITQM